MATIDEPAKPADNISDIENDIAQTREELGHTVDALKEKLDLKAQAKHKVNDVKDSATERVHNVQEHAARFATDVKEAATDEQGKSKPAVPIGGAAITAVAVLVVVWLWKRR